jgi:hypothetical protein
MKARPVRFFSMTVAKPGLLLIRSCLRLGFGFHRFYKGKTRMDEQKQPINFCDESTFSIETLQYWPIGKPAPPGWEDAGDMKGHHSQYSYLIKKLDF